MKICEIKHCNDIYISYKSCCAKDDKLKIEIMFPRVEGVTEVALQLFGDGINNNTYQEIPLFWNNLINGFDFYQCRIHCNDLGVGLFYYRYRIKSYDSYCFYGSRDIYNNLYKLDDENTGLIQLMIYENRNTYPNWLFGGIMYQIFVDRFCKSGKCAPKSYAIMNNDWENGIPQYSEKRGDYVENNMFFGGDLYGVVSKLDYLKSLSVNCIYLCPVFDAYSNHKYDTGDYMSVDSMFGSDEALDLLISEAHKRSIHIILDGVFNHTGSDSVYFNKKGRYKSLGAYQSKNSVYFDWYNFRSFPDDYECWWNVKILPRVKSDTPSYRKFILGENGVIEKWTKMGIDGFRLDVADELSDSFLNELNTKVKKINPQGVVYGEVWEDASNKIAYDNRKKYFSGNELDSVMNYPIRDALIDYVKNGSSENLVSTFNTIYSHYPDFSVNLLMNVLGTHDTERILTVLGTDIDENLTGSELSKKRLSEIERKKSIKLLRVAYSVISTLPGVPCVYYGDEAGMEGYRDPFNRMPYPWGREDITILSYYRKIGNLRAENDVYRNGAFYLIFCNRDLLVFLRYTDKKGVITLANRSKKRFYINKYVNNLIDGKKVKTLMPLNTLFFDMCSFCLYDFDGNEILKYDKRDRNMNHIFDLNK